MDDVRAVPSRTIFLTGHRTGVSLEDEFWEGLKEIAQERHMTRSELISVINADRQNANLSSAIRLFVLGFYLDQISDYQGRTREQLNA
jgi:predicted DNA-binding ribbon-helix-helix protein